MNLKLSNQTIELDTQGLSNVVRRKRTTITIRKFWGVGVYID